MRARATQAFVLIGSLAVLGLCLAPAGASSLTLDQAKWTRRARAVYRAYGSKSEQWRAERAVLSEGRRKTATELRRLLPKRPPTDALGFPVSFTMALLGGRKSDWLRLSELAIDLDVGMDPHPGRPSPASPTSRLPVATPSARPRGDSWRTRRRTRSASARSSPGRGSQVDGKTERLMGWEA